MESKEQKREEKDEDEEETMVQRRGELCGEREREPGFGVRVGSARLAFALPGFTVL